MSSSSNEEVLVRRLTSSPIDAYVAGLGLVALASAVVVARWSGASSHGLLPVALVALFALAEVFVVHYAVRRNTHTFSLVEVPMVIALVFASPAVFILTRLLGAALALVLHRRQRSTKLVFNLASFTLQDVVAIIVFRSIAGNDISRHTTWAALTAACLVASALGFVLVLIAMRLSGDGHPSARQSMASAVFAMTSTGITTAAAIALVLLWNLEGAAALLLAPAIVGIHYALRSHVVSQTERRHLEAIEETAQLVVPSRTADETIGDLLLHARATFGVERASYVHLGDGLAVFSRTTAPDGSIVDRREPTEHWQSLVDLVPPGRHGVVLTPSRGRTIARNAVPTLPRDGMVAAVTSDGQVVGYLTVTDRLSAVGRFDDDALLVLQLMARQIAVALAGETPPDVDDFHLLEAELNHRVRRDALTGLANDIGMRDRLVGELTHAGSQRLALVVVRVSVLGCPDDEVDDGLMLVTSQRLRTCVRGRDTVARPSADEFAVIASTPGGEHDALALGQRILWTLSTAMNLDGAEHRLDVGVGICLRGTINDPDVMLDRAGNACRRAESNPRRIEVTNA
jgi:GGDEF domain-containing protein